MSDDRLTDTEGLGSLLEKRVGLLLGGLLGAVWRLACSHEFTSSNQEETYKGWRPAWTFL
jgi:hypothetical protein